MEQFKNEIFEKFGKAWCRELRNIRNARNAGDKKAAEMIYLQTLGILDAIEILGFDVEEFTAHYKANRKQYRKELSEQEL